MSVHAFAPLGLNYDRPNRNTCLNRLIDQVSVYWMAIGAESGTLNLCFGGGVGAAAVVQRAAQIAALAGPRIG